MNKPRWLRTPSHKHIPVWVFVFLFVGTLISVLAGQKPSRQFSEGHIFTLFSCFLLGTSALAAFLVYQKRSHGRERPCGIVRAPEFLWVLIGLGFAYLAVDEVGCIHEKSSRMIRQLFHLEDTGLAERLDSVIITTYGLIGLLALWLYRAEIRFFRAIWGGVTVGFVLLGMHVVLDMLSEDSTFFRGYFGTHWRMAFEWTKVIEDGGKVMANAFFLRAFLEAWILARNDPKPRALPGETGSPEA